MRHQPDLHTHELVELERSAASRWSLSPSGHGSGYVVWPTSPRRRGAGGRAAREPSRFGLLQTRGDELVELPREDFRLPRLRVHRHDRARFSPTRSRMSTIMVICNRERRQYLTRPEERGFCTLRQLLLPPALVEEHDAQAGRPVEDFGLDHGAALARPETADLLDLCEHPVASSPIVSSAISARFVRSWYRRGSAAVGRGCCGSTSARDARVGTHGSSRPSASSPGQPVRLTDHLLDADEVRYSGWSPSCTRISSCGCAARCSSSRARCCRRRRRPRAR